MVLTKSAIAIAPTNDDILADSPYEKNSFNKIVLRVYKKISVLIKELTLCNSAFEFITDYALEQKKEKIKTIISKYR